MPAAMTPAEKAPPPAPAGGRRYGDTTRPPLTGRRGLRQRLKRFLRARKGTVAVEAMVAMPVLIFALLMTVLLSDMFKSQTTSLRAAYTVADTLSRRVDPVDGDYIDGTATLYRYLARARHGTWLRVSSIAYDPLNEHHLIVWSHNAKGGQPLTTAELNQGLHNRLTVLPEGETLILVEAGTQWKSFAEGWFGNREFVQVAVTRPRFTPQLRFDDGDSIIFHIFGSGTCDDGDTLCGTEGSNTPP